MSEQRPKTPQRRPILPPPQPRNEQPRASTSSAGNSSAGTSEDPQRSDRESLSAQTRRRVREEQNTAYLEHPYMVKFNNKKAKVLQLMEQLFELGDSDLIVCDMETGLNDFSKNLKFADSLEDLSKCMTRMAGKCSQVATKIRARISIAKEDKRLIQDIVELAEITDPAEKDPHSALKEDPKPFVKTSEFRVKRERPIVVDDTVEYEEPSNKKSKSKSKKQLVYSGDADTHFSFPKNNDYDDTQYPNTICAICDKSLRDRTEFRNHISNHHREIFRCLKCGKIYRTEVSFAAHVRTHYGERFKCDDCNMIFDRKTTLINHKQKHSGETMKCKKCGKTYVFRQNYLEHVKYRHLPTKSIQCPICKKYYWTPTTMRSHKYKIHGSVQELVYGIEN